MSYNNIGSALKKQDKFQEAIEAYNEALSIKPDFDEAYYNIGNVLKDQGKLEKAIEAYKKAISLKPENAEVFNNMASALAEQGKPEESIEAYNKAISLKPGHAEAHRHLSNLRKYSLNDEQFKICINLYKKKNLSSKDRCHLSFALAKMCEDMGKLDKAYTYLSTGNQLRKEMLKYDINREQKLFASAKEAQQNIITHALDPAYCDENIVPVFILGMPRSGTTLVEQIVTSHSHVAGAGELPFISRLGAMINFGKTAASKESIFNFRKKYLLELVSHNKGKCFITDKMPHNFLYIPLICAALPEAKIIHVYRDAAATCWSNYKQYFSDKGLGYAYDIKDILSYYDLYRNLMKSWMSFYSDRIYNLNYDKLTLDPEPEIRYLIDYISLMWEDTCLAPQNNKRSVKTASHKQVREKIYQGSSEAWRKYEPFLNGVFDGIDSKGR